MQLNEVDREIFEKKIEEFRKDHGEDILKAVFKLHRDLCNELVGMKDFPIAEIMRYSLYCDFKAGKFNDLTPEQIAEKEGISKRTIYNFFHYFYKRGRGNSKSHAITQYYHSYFRK